MRPSGGMRPSGAGMCRMFTGCMLRSEKVDRRINYQGLWRGRRAFTAAAALVCACLALASPGLCADKLVSVYGSAIPIQTVLQRLAKSAGVEILIQPDVKGTIDLSLKDVTLTTALNAICPTLGLEWEKVKAETDSGSATATEVYVVRVKKAGAGSDSSTVATASATTAANQPAPKPALDFGPQPDSTDSSASAAGSNAGSKPADSTAAANQAAAQPSFKLNAQQLQLVLGGVPQYRANRVLNYWRQQSAAGLRAYTPGAPFYFVNRPYAVMTPYGPYYASPAGGVYYVPGGTVWTVQPYSNHYRRTHKKSSHTSSGSRNPGYS